MAIDLRKIVGITGLPVNPPPAFETIVVVALTICGIAECL